MKKIAIQLAANPRSFKRCYPFFKANILDTLNPDVFIHTWNLKGKERPDVTTDGSCEEYIELYKPKKFIIEDLEYTSGSPAIATVGADGNVKGIAEGTAVITIRGKKWNF